MRHGRAAVKFCAGVANEVKGEKPIVAICALNLKLVQNNPIIRYLMLN
jgi:NADH:ubiquinone oxidoreductase subunit E